MRRKFTRSFLLTFTFRQAYFAPNKRKRIQFLVLQCMLRICKTKISNSILYSHCYCNWCHCGARLCRNNTHLPKAAQLTWISIRRYLCIHLFVPSKLRLSGESSLSERKKKGLKKEIWKLQWKSENASWKFRCEEKTQGDVDWATNNRLIPLIQILTQLWNKSVFSRQQFRNLLPFCFKSSRLLFGIKTRRAIDPFSPPSLFQFSLKSQKKRGMNQVTPSYCRRSSPPPCSFIQSVPVLSRNGDFIPPLCMSIKSEL